MLYIRPASPDMIKEGPTSDGMRDHFHAPDWAHPRLCQYLSKPGPDQSCCGQLAKRKILCHEHVHFSHESIPHPRTAAAAPNNLWAAISVFSSNN
jgi:hypothetical protein